MLFNVLNYPLIQRSCEILICRDLVPNIRRADVQERHIGKMSDPVFGHRSIETLVDLLDELFAGPGWPGHNHRLGELEYSLPVLPLGKRQHVVRPDEQENTRMLTMTLAHGFERIHGVACPFTIEFERVDLGMRYLIDDKPKHRQAMRCRRGRFISPQWIQCGGDIDNFPAAKLLRDDGGELGMGEMGRIECAAEDEDGLGVTGHALSLA